MAAPYPTVISCHPSVSSITTTAGTFTVTKGLFTDSSDADATILIQDYNKTRMGSTNLSNGQCTLIVPPNLVSITINGNTYISALTANVNQLTGVSAADASALCFDSNALPFAIANATPGS